MYTFSPSHAKTQNNTIFCYVRNRYIQNGPEEVVRQSILYYLINDLGFSANDIKLEIVLPKIGRPDIVVYIANDPVIVVECKAPTVLLTDCVFDTQAINYAQELRAKLVWVCNGAESRFYASKDGGLNFNEIENIPDLHEITPDLYKYKPLDKLIEPVAFEALYDEKTRFDYNRSRMGYIPTFWLYGDLNTHVAAGIIRLGEFIFGQKSFPKGSTFGQYEILDDLGVRTKKMANPGQHMNNLYRSIEIMNTQTRESFVFAFGFMAYPEQHLTFNFPQDDVRKAVAEIKLTNKEVLVNKTEVQLIHRRSINVQSYKPPVGFFEYLAECSVEFSNLTKPSRPVVGSFDLREFPGLQSESWRRFMKHFFEYALLVREYRKYASAYPRTKKKVESDASWRKQVQVLMKSKKYLEALALLDRELLNEVSVSERKSLVIKKIRVAEKACATDLSQKDMSNMQAFLLQTMLTRYELDPTSVEACLELAKHYLDVVDDLDQALFYIKEAEKHSNEDFEVLRVRALIEYGLENYQDAANMFMQLTDRFENEVDYQYNVLLSYFKADDFQRVLEAWEKFGFTDEIVNVLKDCQYSETKRCAAFLELALPKHPTNQDFVDIQALCYYAFRQFDKTLNGFLRLASLSESPLVNWQIASALVMLDRWEEARDYMELIPQEDLEAEPISMLFYASVLHRFGEVKKAAEIVRTLKSRKIEDIFVLYILALLGDEQAKAQEIKDDILANEGELYFESETEYILRGFGLRD
jgi:tetratricopeptide (TPR) repeat protein